LLCVTRLDVATRPCGHPGRALSPYVTRLDMATRPCGHPGRASPHVRRPKADRSSALVPARPGARPLPGHRGAPCWPAGVRPAERAGGLVGGRRAGEPARGRAATSARSARVPMSRVPMSLAHPHAHRNIGTIARARAPCEVSRLAIGPRQAAAGKKWESDRNIAPGRQSTGRQGPVQAPRRGDNGTAPAWWPQGVPRRCSPPPRGLEAANMGGISAPGERPDAIPGGPGSQGSARVTGLGGPSRAANRTRAAMQRRHHSRRESGTSASRPRISSDIDEIKCRDTETPGHREKPVQHRHAAPIGRIVMHGQQRRRSEPIETLPMCAYKP
jgi:hypothetical protein